MTGKLRPARAAAAGVSAMDMKKIIVLGGDGFCGWPTTLHLADQVCLYLLATRSASVWSTISHGERSFPSTLHL